MRRRPRSNSRQITVSIYEYGELSCRCYLALEKVQCTFNNIPGPPFSLSKDVWRKGHSKNGPFRMLVPMRTAYEIFDNAEYQSYSDQRGIVAKLDTLTSTHAYQIKNKVAEWIELKDFQPDCVAIKYIEVRLDYEKHMGRMQLQCSPLSRKAEHAVGKIQKQAANEARHDDRSRDFRRQCAEWMNYLLVEKRRQLNTSDPSMWPENQPWLIADIWTATIIIWISGCPKDPSR